MRWYWSAVNRYLRPKDTAILLTSLVGLDADRTGLSMPRAGYTPWARRLVRCPDGTRARPGQDRRRTPQARHIADKEAYT
jgi:hypothetical protein